MTYTVKTNHIIVISTVIGICTKIDRQYLHEVFKGQKVVRAFHVKSDALIEFATLSSEHYT